MTTPEELETTEVAAPAEEPEVEPYVEPHYVIDPARVTELERSLSVLLLDRRCPSCQAQLESETETPPDEAQIKEISECCSIKEGFIRPEMPMQEIVFRTLLSEAPRPVSLEELHFAVTDKSYSPMNPRSISANRPQTCTRQGHLLRL